MNRQYSLARIVWFAAATSFLLLVNLGTASGATAATANPPLTNPANDDAISSILQEIDQLPTVPIEWINPATGDPYTSTEIGEGLTAAEEATGTLPALSTLGTLTLGAGALYVGWKIGSPLGNFIYRKITGDTSAPATYSVRWTPYVCGTSTATGGFNDGNVIVGSHSDCSLISGAMEAQGYLASVNGVRIGCWANCTAATGSPQALKDAELSALDGTRLYDDPSNPYGPQCDSVSPSNCFVVYRSWGQMRALTRIDTSTSSEYTNAPQQVSTSNWTPPQPSSEQLQNGINACSGSSAQQEACQAAINHELDPTDAWLWLPDCSGYLLTDCEDLVASAATAADEPTPSFAFTAVDSSNQNDRTLPGAVLRQSIVAGSSTTVAFSTNPDPMNGLSGGDGYGGGGGSTTTADGPQCDFPDWAPPPEWESLISPMNPDNQVYLDACDEAWQAAQAAGMVDEFGLPTSWTNDDNVLIRGKYFRNETAIDTLTSDGSNIDDWAKITSPTFETPDGPAELHVYKNLSTGSINTSIDWKLVFDTPF